MAMKYGLILPQGWTMDLAGIKNPIEAYETTTRFAQLADELGYASIWLVDHFHTLQPSQEVTFECWTSTAALARDTKRVRIGQMVTCNGYRNPALLAKMASTVDVLSHGRLNFGIGAGWCEQEYRTYGYEYPDAPDRLRHLREAVQVILAMWTQDEAIFEGKYYQVRGAINQPKGVQKPHIPLLIGGGGEQVTLKIVAQYADACNVNGSIPTIEHKFAVLKQHCENVGRDYQTIHRTATAQCIIGETEEKAQAMFSKVSQDPRHRKWMHNAFVGNPDTIRKRLAEYEAIGVQELILGFSDMPQLDSVRLFAREFLS